jgi:hypothetical protein
MRAPPEYARKPAAFAPVTRVDVSQTPIHRGLQRTLDGLGTVARKTRYVVSALGQEPPVATNAFARTTSFHCNPMDGRLLTADPCIRPVYQGGYGPFSNPFENPARRFARDVGVHGV